MRKASLFFQILSILSLSSTAFARFPHSDPIESNQVYSFGLLQTGLLEALKDVKAGDILILGESHGTGEMAAQQLQVLQQLRNQGLQVSVGMEFFERQYQTSVDAVRSGQLSETDFLKQIKWGSLPYEAYRSQVNFPAYPGEFVKALNAPAWLTSKISKVGIVGLSETEKLELPADFSIGNSGYYRRFEEAMGGHASPEAMARYFEAQSVWDAVMAHEAVDFVSVHPDQVLVIIVGEFHVAYGGGLPDRIRQDLAKNPALKTQIRTFSLINLEGMSQDEREQSIRPSQVDGPRADFVWTSQF